MYTPTDVCHSASEDDDDDDLVVYIQEENPNAEKLKKHFKTNLRKRY